MLYAQNGAGVEHFEKKIRPLLVENCYACHSEKTIASGGLKLDTKESVLQGGSRGTAVVPGSPEASLMLRAVRHEDDELKMPPTGRLSDSQIEDLRRWIEEGAPDPRAAGARREAPGIDWDEAKKFWAFQPLQKPASPGVRDESWPRTLIDPFVLAKLEAQSLTPASRADKRVWLRRATFDLTGTRVSAEAIVVASVMPAEGPSLGVPPSGTWMCRSTLV